MKHVLAFVTAAAALGAKLSAQPTTAVLPHPKQMKGQQVVFRLPMPTELPKKHDGPWVTEVAGRLMVEDVPADSILGFPSELTCKVERANEYKNVQLIGLSLKCGSDYRWLFVPIDSATALRAVNTVLAPASQWQLVVKEARERIRPVVFSGVLSSVPEAMQIFLLDAARKGDFSPYFSARSFQSKTYLRIDLGLYPSIMNTARLNLNQRISTALTASLLTYVKAFGLGLASTGSMEGINLRVAIGHRNFVTGSYGFNRDYVEFYLKTADIVRFANAEITGQELIDQSVVLVNDNRTKVVLAEAH